MQKNFNYMFQVHYKCFLLCCIHQTAKKVKYIFISLYANFSLLPFNIISEKNYTNAFTAN